MTVNPLKGRTAWWLRQLKPDCGENTIAQVLQTMKDYGGGDCLCLKVMDGLDYQGTFDVTLPINSLSDILAVRDLCHSMGVAFCPVVLPRGLIGEAEKHGAIAAAVGCLMIDLERGSGYWDHHDVSGIPIYAQALRVAAGDAYLINQPDPRDSYVCEAPKAFFDAVCAQHYVGWSDVGWTDVNLEVNRFYSLSPLYRDAYVTLYGKDRIDLAVTFWESVMQRAEGFCVFSFGPMDGAELNYFRDNAPRPVATPDPIDGNPSPSPVPVADVKSALVRLTSAQQHYANAETEQQAGNGDVAAAVADLTVPNQPPSQAWIKPLANYIVTQEFGVPELGNGAPHTGIDLAAPEGTPIISATKGVVVDVLDQGQQHYGKSVWVAPDTGTQIIYGHMSRQDAQKGKVVAQGEQLGLVGHTGFATGDHLHLEVRVNGQPVNPRQFLAL